jgi:hypothetical protein
MFSMTWLVKASSDGRALQDRLNVIAGLKRIGVADHQQGAKARARHQPHAGAQDQHAGALGVDQRAGDVEPVLGQECLQVVAGDPPGDVREAAADQVRVAVAQVPQSAVNRAPATACFDLALEVGLAHWTNSEAQAVVGENLQLLGVVRRLAAHHGVGAAGVVADHTAEGAVLVRRWIGSQRQMMLLGCVAELVADHAWLDPGCAPVGVCLRDVVDVLGEVDDHRNVAALSGEAGATTSAEDRHPMLMADRDGGNDVVQVARDDDADGHLAVHRQVGHLECPAAVIEPDLTTDGSS